jgi:NTE family protein
MIKNLVISGGGVKIIASLGVIKYLKENDLLKSIKNYYGTSAGSIICLMLTLGFELEEMIKFIENFDLDKLIIVNTENLFTTFNVCENTKFEKVIKLFLNFKLNNINDVKKINYENITMKELYNKTNKYLSITSTCLTTQEAVYISHDTFPNIPVWKAILMSCSIPLIFKPIEWEDKIYVDGGLIDNFPLFNIKLNDIKYTLGIQINLNCKPSSSEDRNIYNYVINLIEIILESQIEIKPYNIISIKIDNSLIHNALSVDINIDTKKKIIMSAYEQSKIQFSKIQFSKKTCEAETQTVSSKLRSRSNSF